MIRLIYYCFYCQDSNVTNLSIKLLIILFFTYILIFSKFSGIANKQKAFNKLQGEIQKDINPSMRAILIDWLVEVMFLDGQLAMWSI